jgi:hypothetical protein
MMLYRNASLVEVLRYAEREFERVKELHKLK